MEGHVACHFKCSGPCAVVSIAPARFVIRVNEAKADTGKGVDKNSTGEARKEFYSFGNITGPDGASNRKT